MSNAARLPGIYFETEPRQPASVLPRMDIAAFVGFSANGPLNVPVPVEDKGRFRDIFGDDIVLAWDREKNVPQSSLLGGTVESFFRNGGRRCWVMRVGDSNMPVRRFKLKGLVSAGIDHFDSSGRDGNAAEAYARSPGAWADQLLVDAVLYKERLAFPELDYQETGQFLEYRLRAGSAPAKLAAGDLIEIVLDSEQPKLYLFISAIEKSTAGIQAKGSEAYWYRAAYASPPEAGHTSWIRVAEQDALQLFRDWQGEMSPSRIVSASLLRFEIRSRVHDNERHIGDLAFHSDHPRAWMHLPADEALFRAAVQPELEGLFSQASFPRFPLSGPDKPNTSYLPLGMASRPADLADMIDTSPIDFDRDIEAFSDEYFVDNRLKRVFSAALLGEAEHLHYVVGLALTGLHALLPIEEITLLSVPDAVHRSWGKLIVDRSESIPAPALKEIPERPDRFGAYRIAWTPIAEAEAYTLQHDNSPEFRNPVIIEVAERENASEEIANYVDIALPNDCPERRYFRIRALRGGLASPWSGTRGRSLPVTGFTSCAMRPLDEIHLEQCVTSSPSDGDLTLNWSLLDSDQPFPEVFELQAAADMAFESPEVVYAGPDREFSVAVPLNVAVYYRVRARRADGGGPWSNTEVIQPWSLRTPVLDEPEDYDDAALVAIHSALIRFCAARGDLWACLSLPRHYRQKELLNHLKQLSAHGGESQGSSKTQVPPLNYAEANILSYAGLFHPWLGSRKEEDATGKEAAQSVAFVPPDGAVLGSMSGQAIAQGVWYAPANLPLKGVVALDSNVSDQDWPRLTAQNVNLVSRDPRGFLLRNAETLAQSGELSQISVRRLLILLRRLALREGRAYVFESNSADFRALVQHRFEQVLSQLYVRGAFAGATPAVAYRVVVDDSVNTRQGMEQGRFVVELQVSPSRPLRFITIRLSETGGNRLKLEEF